MRVRVVADIERFTRGMDEAEKRQIPFALARALTWTAKDAQTDVREELPRRFTIRRPFISNNIRITPATKAKPEALVYASDRVPFMARQETGGTKRGQAHRIAVPVKARRNKRDMITDANRPQAVRTKPSVFMLATSMGAGIMRRVGKARYPVEILYWLKRSVQVKPRFGFKATTGTSVGRSFGPRFVDSLSKAMGHMG